MRLFCTLALAALLCGCTRPASELTSTVTIQPPRSGFFDRVSSQALTGLPAGKKACFGVEVSGPGVPQVSAGSSCVQLGIFAGFTEGESLSLEVPRGAQRTFQLFLHLVDAADPCPDFQSGFMTSANAQKTYLAGSATGVTIEKTEETVGISASFPGEANHLLASGQASCLGPSLKGMLFSNGDVVDSAMQPLSVVSDATTESFYLTPLGGALGVGMMTSGGMLNFNAASARVLPPETFSLTRKPDSGVFYALLHSGRIVEVDATNGLYAEPMICPFATPNCEVPVWMQSISAGLGTSLYGLDHAGQIYQMTSTGPELTGVTVPESITQISYY